MNELEGGTSPNQTKVKPQNLHMIELYKIFMLKYDSDLTLKTIGKCIQRQYDTRNHRFALQQSHIQYMICVNLVFPIGLSHCGIVYRTT